MLDLTHAGATAQCERSGVNPASQRSDIEMSMYFELLRTHTQSTQTRATHTDTYSLTTRTHSVSPLYYLSNTRSKWQRTHYSGPGV